MSIFISYNRNDKDFVDKLSRELIKNNIVVWRDEWQIEVGDSIINEIQKGLEKSSFICIVWSKNAAKSKWVEKELNAALIKEIEEDRKILLPIVIDDSKLPLLLKDKLYIDFRYSFQEGVKKLINAVADKFNLLSGKITNNDYLTYYGTDLVCYSDKLEIYLDIISQDKNVDYFILTKIKFTCNNTLLDQFKLYKKDKQESDFVSQIVYICKQAMGKKRIIVGGKEIGRIQFDVVDDKSDLSFNVDIVSKKIGIDDGKYVVFNVAALLDFYNSRL